MNHRCRTPDRAENMYELLQPQKDALLPNDTLPSVLQRGFHLEVLSYSQPLEEQLDRRFVSQSHHALSLARSASASVVRSPRSRAAIDRSVLFPGRAYRQ